MARPRKEPAPAQVEPITFTNIVKSRTLHLGDGRKLAYGESAEVTAELAALLG